MTSAIPPRRRLADDLRAAIDRGEIELRYQPQVRIADERITGVEVLARWRHHRLGELGAARLFAAARRAGLSEALSRHIQEQALAVVGAWGAALAPVSVALNVTAADLGRSGFAAELLARAAAHGVAPERLTAEVTEHEPIADLPAAAAVLAELRAAGVAVALDDFGSGHSSVAWLRALPLDYLKLGGDLSRDLLRSAREQVVTRHVIAMGRELGLGVIAEEVEDEAHCAALAAAGATHYQGYLCAGPLAAADLVRMMEEGA